MIVPRVPLGRSTTGREANGMVRHGAAVYRVCKGSLDWQVTRTEARRATRASCWYRPGGYWTYVGDDLEGQKQREAERVGAQALGAQEMGLGERG